MLVACLFAFVVSAQTTKKYTLTFSQLNTMQVKAALKVTNSVFETPVTIENENYNVFIYRTQKIVKREDLEALLTQNGFKLQDFKSEEE